MRPLPLLLLCAGLLSAQDAKDARSPETVRYRDLPEILQEIEREVEAGDKASVVWLIDPVPSLRESGAGDQLASLIPQLFKKPRVSHAIVAMGEPPIVVQRPTDDLARFTSSMKQLVAGNPDPSIKNCLANVREAAKIAAGASGAKKFVVMLSPENGDNEDNLEDTLKMLRGGGVVFLPVVPEAVYSDPYWASALNGTSYYFDVEKFRKLPFQLRGPDSAYIEYPYGWPFTRVDPAYTVPSGFAPYGIDRLATYTGGRAYLYSGEKSSLSFCQRYVCPLCSGRHKACGAVYDELKLKVTAPEIGSRAEYAAKYGREKLYAAIVNVWDRLHHESILRGTPPLLAGPGGLTENKPSDKKERERSPLGREFSNDWRTQKQDALGRADLVDKAAADMIDAAKKLEKESSLRTRGAADAFTVHLLLLAQAYRQFAEFCEEMLKPRKAANPDEVGGSLFDSPNGERVIGYHYRPYPLCHGGARLKEVVFLGSLAGLHAALDVADRMIEKHKGTPWEVLIRRGSVPIFYPVFERPASKGSTGGSRTRPTSGSTGNSTETPAAPARPSRPSTGDSDRGSGTATGGNR